jgi:SNF2 family DNA or RNA helicase
MNFKTKPYDHQIKAFERFKNSDYFALFADMGTGKSKITIDIAAHRFLIKQSDRMLLIAPNNVHQQWVTEQFPAHCPVPWRPFVWRSSKSGSRTWLNALEDFIDIEPWRFLLVFAVNVEAFSSDAVVPYVARFLKAGFPFSVVDEGTRIKNRGAKRAKTIHKINKYGQRAILTGTPTAKSPFDLWSMMEFLKANYFDTNFFIFQNRYGIMMQGVNPINSARYTTLIDQKVFNIIKGKLKAKHAERTLEASFKQAPEEQTLQSTPLTDEDYEAISVMMKVSEKNVRFIDTQEMFVRYKRLDELRELIAKDVFSVRKEDCLDLPPKVYEKIYVDMSPEQAKIYDDLRVTLLAEYDGKEVSVANKVALTTRLMQVAGGFFPYAREAVEIVGGVRFAKLVGEAQAIGEVNTKMRAILDDLEEMDDSRQVIIWAHFVAELKLIQHALSEAGYTCRLYYGGTPENERKKIIEEFKTNTFRIFVGNAATAGFGLNFQNATIQYYFSNTFRTEDRLQAEDRSHRIGVKQTVLYKDILAKGTIDERVYENIAVGKDLNEYFKGVSIRELLAPPPEPEDITF